MKKAKLLLSALAVFAVVGGALAFKAKTFTLQKYCIAPNTTSQSCTIPLAVGSMFVADGTPQISYTTTSLDTCPSEGPCNAVGRSVDDGE